MLWTAALLAAQSPTGNQVNPTGELLKMVGMIGIFIFIFYFVAIRPQQKRAKEHEAMLKTLKRGDRVVTNSGILGIVVSVKDESVTVKSDDSKLEITKSAIAQILQRSESSDA
ncbi:MAG TPA: preprotein translocase subunit YajC [Verrucomicrobiota bacterium]|nr:preprotein translocase subunit YajC [Verrucomicrobiota bacterium]